MKNKISLKNMIKKKGQVVDVICSHPFNKNAISKFSTVHNLTVQEQGSCILFFPKNMKQTMLSIWYNLEFLLIDDMTFWNQIGGSPDLY